MNLGLEHKLAIITGSTQGIGFAAAHALAREGATVIVNGRSDSSTRNAADRINADFPDRAIPAAADLAAADGCADFMQRSRDAAGNRDPDILINNVGLFNPVPFEDIADDEWQQFYDVNVMAGVRLSRAVLPAMRQRNWGRIVFISSESGINIPEEMIHYGMTKASQIAVANGLAKTLRGTGITVNAVLPGPTWTEGVAEFVRKVAEQQGVDADDMKQQFVANNRPTSIIQRFASPGEVAEVIAFICSENASTITGTAQRADGGITSFVG